jgi:hypothetical protein
MAVVWREADTALALALPEVFRMLHFAETTVSGISVILVGTEPFGYRGIIPGIVRIGPWMLMGTGVAIQRKPANRTLSQPGIALRHQ